MGVQDRDWYWNDRAKKARQRYWQTADERGKPRKTTHPRPPRRQTQRTNWRALYIKLFYIAGWLYTGAWLQKTWHLLG